MAGYGAVEGDNPGYYSAYNIAVLVEDGGRKASMKPNELEKSKS
jgi:hypothetical protein